MKINKIIHESQSNYNHKHFSNNNSSTKLLPNNKFKQEIPLSTNIFKNHELQKSLSINIFNNNRNSSNCNFQDKYNFLFNQKNSFLTTIPIHINKKNNNLPKMQNFFSNTQNNYLNNFRNNSFDLKKRNNKQKFELKCFNDEKCFSTSKKQKPYKFPKNFFVIRKYRVNHDTNIFNLKHVLTDYTKEYERNSYKIKKVVQNDMFINKIKTDLLKLKFNNRIKPFDDL